MNKDEKIKKNNSFKNCGFLILVLFIVAVFVTLCMPKTKQAELHSFSDYANEFICSVE